MCVYTHAVYVCICVFIYVCVYMYVSVSLDSWFFFLRLIGNNKLFLQGITLQGFEHWKCLVYSSFPKSGVKEQRRSCPFISYIIKTRCWWEFSVPWKLHLLPVLWKEKSNKEVRQGALSDPQGHCIPSLGPLPSGKMSEANTQAQQGWGAGDSHLWLAAEQWSLTASASKCLLETVHPSSCNQG